jgi:Arc/MetJ family transcription regulator
MKFTIDIDNDLMAKARRLNGNKTRKETIEEALGLFIALESQKKLIDLWGEIQLDDAAYR